MPDLLTIADAIATASEIPFTVAWIALVTFLVSGFLSMTPGERAELRKDLETPSPGDWANQPKRDDA